jgi:uncharacterized protein (UPF0332 family)
MELIDIEKIDSSPFQHRKSMSAGKHKELASSKVRDWLIESVLFHKFMEQAQNIFKNMSKPLE